MRLFGEAKAATNIVMRQHRTATKGNEVRHHFVQDVATREAYEGYEDPLLRPNPRLCLDWGDEAPLAVRDMAAAVVPVQNTGPEDGKRGRRGGRCPIIKIHWGEMGGVPILRSVVAKKTTGKMM